MQNIDLPKVTIVTVVYNSKDFLEETIDCVRKQNYPDKEFVVIDGGSTDGTVDIIKKHEDVITFWSSEPDNGIYDAMNKGIKSAGEDGYITFLNAGDFYCNDNVLLDLFSGIGEEFDVVYGDTLVFNDGEIEDYTYQEAVDFTVENLFKRSSAAVCHQSIFVHKRSCPMYDAALIFKGELNWFYDILEQKKEIKYINRKIPVSYYRAGGFGDKHYWKNNFEEIGLIYKKFGISAFLKPGYMLHLFHLVKWGFKLDFLDYPIKFLRVLRKLFFATCHPIQYNRLLRLKFGGYLQEKNWLKHTKISDRYFYKKVDVNSCTYPFIDFFFCKKIGGFKLLELNGLNSSIYFRDELDKPNKVDRVFTDKKLYDQLAKYENITARCFASLKEFIAKCSFEYDIVLINDTKVITEELISLLNKGGVIICNEGEDKRLHTNTILKKHGFKMLPFTGMSPGSRKMNNTMLLYKDSNIFNI